LIFSTCFPDAQADAPKLPVAVGLPTYELKRGARPTLVITRRFICCCLDLPLKDLGRALGVSFTTVKKLRIWSGLPCWPRRSIQVGKFPFLSFGHIRALRRQNMSCFDKDAHHVVGRVGEGDGWLWGEVEVCGGAVGVCGGEAIVEVSVFACVLATRTLWSATRP
jgi:hypothetical protein